MSPLTVGQIAAAINFGLIFLQLTTPLFQVLLLVGSLQGENTAITWSVASRFIQSSLWPSILSCDTSAGTNDGVSMRVSINALVSTFGAILIVVAGILTPLGLVETIVPGSLIIAEFEYARDPTPFGSETPARDLYLWSRICGDGEFPCPGVDPLDFVVVDIPYRTIYDTYVLPNLTNCFSSGLNGKGDLRASPFDIQFRQYQSLSSDVEVQSASSGKRRITNTTGKFSMVENLILLNEIVVREGVVADLVNGGVGFRNHTVPTAPRMTYGSTWTEDMLWLEPVSVCVDTNWSIEHKQRSAPYSTYSPIWLTDLSLVNRGGGIVPTQLPNRSLSYQPSQSNPELYSRAQLAALIFNYRLSELLSLTSANVSAGSIYEVGDYGVWNMLTFQDFNGFKGLTLGPLRDPWNEWNHMLPVRDWPERIRLDPAQFSLDDFDIPAFEDYQWRWITQDNPLIEPPDIPVEEAISACQGVMRDSIPDIDLVLIRCGFLLTPPSRITAPSEHSSQSLYFCASTVRATIKEVSFEYKQTSDSPSLSDLSVRSVVAKTYPTRSSEPTWAVEKLGSHWNVQSIQPLWGLVDSSTAKDVQKLQIFQGMSLYLPYFGFDTDYNYNGLEDSMASSTGPGSFLDYLYHSGNDLAFYPSGLDFQGTSNGGMLAKWRELSTSPETATKIPNLIWTDLAANMLVGTKSLLLAYPDTHSYQVRSNRRRIFFHYAWAIPALVCAAIWVICASMCVILYLIPECRVRLRATRLRDVINQLSVGRALVVKDQFDAIRSGGSTREWLISAGRTRIKLFPPKDVFEGDMEMSDVPATSQSDRSRRNALGQAEQLAWGRQRRASV